jgi:5-methylcytosine-specific restriction protein A
MAPLRPLRPCLHYGCRELVRGQARCELHTKSRAAQYAADPVRKASQRLYASRRWKDLRLQAIAAEPTCRMCRARGIVRAGTHLDHVTPWHDEVTFWQPEGGFQVLCASCHSSKTNRADGGFGNPIR